MNDKQLFKQCLTYLKRGKQPITREELIKALEARLLEPDPFITINHHGRQHFSDAGSALVYLHANNGTDWK